MFWFRTENEKKRDDYYRLYVRLNQQKQNTTNW